MNPRIRDESGVAMITALLAVIILSGLAVVFVSRATAETRAASFSENFETAVHVAEAAADTQIAAISVDPQYVTRFADGTEVDLAAAAGINLGDNAAAAAWALSLQPAMSTGAATSPAWIANGTGEGFAVRPRGVVPDPDVVGGYLPANVIYAVGAVPAFDHPRVTVRVVKLQIEQAAFIPEFALLTEARLVLGGNAAIVDPACDPADGTTCSADVHTNQTFTNPGSASTVQGQVTVSGGTCPSGVTAVNGCLGSDDGVEDKDVPLFRARDFYLPDAKPGVDPSSGVVEWYDLCPNQTIRRGSSSGGPCSSAEQLWPSVDAPGTSFKGWSWQAGEWRAGNIEAGVFYVHHADASVNGSAGSGQRAVSILVERNPADPGNSGSLNISGNPQMQAAMDDVLFLTDGDLDMQGTPSGGTCEATPAGQSGFIGVGEQLKTQGSVAIRGAVVVQDLSDLHGLVGRNNDGIGGTMCLEFDPNLAINFTGRWVVTFWNEL